MRALRASRIVVDAEALRLRLQARRIAIRMLLAAVALVFLGCALVLAHIAAWFWLRVNCGWMVHSTAALLAVGDVAVAGVVGVVALRLGPGPAEIEAHLLRRQAWQAAVASVAWPMVVLRVLRLLRQR